MGRRRAVEHGVLASSRMLAGNGDTVSIVLPIALRGLGRGARDGLGSSRTSGGVRRASGEEEGVVGRKGGRRERLRYKAGRKALPKTNDQTLCEERRAGLEEP